MTPNTKKQISTLRLKPYIPLLIFDADEVLVRRQRIVAHVHVAVREAHRLVPRELGLKRRVVGRSRVRVVVVGRGGSRRGDDFPS